MTIPYLHNCQHSESGWCLDCVKNMGEELINMKEELINMKDELVAIHKKNITQFAKEMKIIVEQDGCDCCDPADKHRNGDSLLCETLEKLGYGEGIAIYNSLLYKWYE